MWQLRDNSVYLVHSLIYTVVIIVTNLNQLYCRRINYKLVYRYI